MTTDSLGWVFTTKNNSVPSGFTVFVSRIEPEHSDNNINILLVGTDGSATFSARIKQSYLEDFQSNDEEDKSNSVEWKRWERILRFVFLGECQAEDNVFFDKVQLESYYDSKKEELVLCINWYDPPSPVGSSDSLSSKSSKKTNNSSTEGNVLRLGEVNMKRNRRENINVMGVVLQCCQIMTTFQQQAYSDSLTIKQLDNTVNDVTKISKRNEANIIRKYETFLDEKKLQVQELVRQNTELRKKKGLLK